MPCLIFYLHTWMRYLNLEYFMLSLESVNFFTSHCATVRTILGLEEGEDCIVIGTLYKQMQLKPSILDEYAKERSVIPLVSPRNFVHANDYLILEDESGRIRLVGDTVFPTAYVTGVVIAVYGYEGSDGEFVVKQMLEPGLAPQGQFPSQSSSGEDKYVALVSGLRTCASEANPLQFQLLVDYLTGHLGDEKEQSAAAKVVHVVIAGDSVHLQYNLLTGQSVQSKDQQKLVEPIKELDLALTQLAAAVPTDIMPGSNDPANFSLPQQPLHACLFPGASVYSTFFAATNPHCFELDGVRILGTSGQNIDDLDKYSVADSKVEFMERTLRWRHIAPTAPDTLGCYPYTDRDPFILNACPHIYFCGNQKKYETKLLQDERGRTVRLISVPRFCDTGVAVLVNLKNLDCHSLSLSTDMLKSNGI
ncbi:hypothetical protein KP509_24G038500 [Ceratopteris richardii]|uniref:DNA polymerase delta small subunit n=1 Tax=Ceratopteris richardii TaxID=49495 RepID=A0A8T2RWW4_CERRI|nr:hypothetical protein KP509_24G038500 [Ceratopteris richardii]